MKLTSLGSGSSGNAFLLETEDQRLLLDCGIGARALNSALAKSSLPLTVLISHEHIDHVRSLSSVLRRHACQVVATDGTFSAIGKQAGWTTVRAGDRIRFGSVDITFVDVSHDAAEPCGFFIENETTKLSLLTDLGSVTSEILDIISSSDVAVLESNYDEQMLRRGPYPAHLKRRIRSATGHLSNDDCAATLADAARQNMQGIWLCHLSHNNNTAESAVSASEGALRAVGKSIPVTALPRFDAMPILPAALSPRQAILGLTDL